MLDFCFPPDFETAADFDTWLALILTPGLSLLLIPAQTLTLSSSEPELYPQS